MILLYTNLSIATLVGEIVLTKTIYKCCVLNVGVRDLSIDFNSLDILDVDMILEMIDC